VRLGAGLPVDDDLTEEGLVLEASSIPAFFDLP